MHEIMRGWMVERASSTYDSTSHVQPHQQSLEIDQEMKDVEAAAPAGGSLDGAILLAPLAHQPDTSELADSQEDDGYVYTPSDWVMMGVTVARLANGQPIDAWCDDVRDWFEATATLVASDSPPCTLEVRVQFTHWADSYTQIMPIEQAWRFLLPLRERTQAAPKNKAGFENMFTCRECEEAGEVLCCDECS